MSLKTLKEHDDDRMAVHERRLKAMEPHPNGIACPTCGEELWDSSPGLVLTSSPEQKNVHCPACKWSGYAYL